MHKNIFRLVTVLLIAIGLLGLLDIHLHRGGTLDYGMTREAVVESTGTNNSPSESVSASAALPAVQAQESGAASQSEWEAQQFQNSMIFLVIIIFACTGLVLYLGYFKNSTVYHGKERRRKQA